MKKQLQFFWIGFILFLTGVFSSEASASSYGSTECFLASVGEILLPGAGYLYTWQPDKVLIFGSLRWSATFNAYRQKENSDFQKKPTLYIEKKDEFAKDKETSHQFLNKSTMYYAAYSNFETKLGWGNAWDIYAHDCQNSKEVYEVVVSPLNVTHWYDNWMVLLGISFSTYSIMNDDRIVHFGNGATFAEYKQLAFADQLLANGFGEEAIFRAGLQKSLGQWMGSRHLGIWTTAAIFGLAHTQYGIGGKLIVGLMGAYLGYIYQPNDSEHDLGSAVAYHAWHNFLIYALTPEYNEQDEPFDTKKDARELTEDWYQKNPQRHTAEKKYQLINVNIAF